MGPIVHTKGWSGSRIWDPSYSGVPQAVFARRPTRSNTAIAAELTDAAAKGRPFASAGAFFSISPEILKPIRRERRVTVEAIDLWPKCWIDQHAVRTVAELGLSDLYVPENRRSELEHIPDVLAEGARLDPFSPRHVRHFAQSDLLNLIGELLAFRFIGRAHPVSHELLDLRDIGPAEPGARACARQAKVDGGIGDVRRMPPREKQVPATLRGRLLACSRDQVCRKIHRLENDLEADRFQSLARDNRCGVKERNVGDMKHHDRLAIVARILHELPRSCEVVLHDWFGTYTRGIRAAAGKYRIASSVILRLSDGPSQICDLVHHVEQCLARLLVVERRMEAVRLKPALRPEGVDERCL